jgi:hypothetical protein
MRKYLELLARAFRGLRGDPAELRRRLRDLALTSSARGFARRFVAADADAAGLRADNPLRRFFESRVEGPGIWKWEHYFDIYQRHLARFVGHDPNVVEVGVYSGGSLDMWQAYFGPGCTIHGVDIEPACRSYRREHVEIHIGDQASRHFWREFRARVPQIDVLIDDGGHEYKQQIITLEEMLPHLRPGGVYLCEDVHGDENAFSAYVSGLSGELNAFGVQPGTPLSAQATAFQRAIRSISVYPYVVVIERSDFAVREFVAPKRGSRWQPFL